MTELATAIAAALDAAGAPPASRSPQHIDGPAADHLLWDPVEAGSPALRALFADHPDWPRFPALVRDLFLTYYKLLPQLRELAAVDPAYSANRRWVETVLTDPATETLRALTRLDDLTAAVATLAAATALSQRIADDPDLARTMQPPSVAPDGPDAASSTNPGRAPDPATTQPGTPSDATPSDPNAAPKNTADGSAPAPSANPDTASKASDSPEASETDPAFTHLAGRLRKAMRQATRQGDAAAHDARETLAAWGLEPADLTTLPMDDRLALLDRLHTPSLQALARRVGRMRGLARTRQRLRLQRGHDERVPMTLGNDLGRVFPSALVALRHPVLRRDFARRFTEGTLPEYDLRPQPRSRQGPILVAVDGSSSMGGDPLHWAVAVALGLSDCARRQHRPFAVCVFNAAVQSAWTAPRGILAPQDLLALATVGASGGTSFQAPLQWALDQLQTTRFAAADLTLLTDGEDQLSDAFRTTLLNAKDTTGLRIFTVLIGATADEVARWSDAVWPLRQLTAGDEVAAAVFDHVTAP